MRKALKAACEKAGVPHCTHHSLRHACATTLLNDEDNVSIEVISKALGHKDTKITQKIYAKCKARNPRMILAKTSLKLL